MNEYGEIAQNVWGKLPQHYSHCKLDQFIVMPNHVHGIVWIIPDSVVGNGLKPFPTFAKPFPTALPEIIRGFKTFSSRRINETQSHFKFQWQKSYHDRIIRNEDELDWIREYIINNPANWYKDSNRINEIRSALISTELQKEKIND